MKFLLKNEPSNLAVSMLINAGQADLLTAKVPEEQLSHLITQNTSQ